MPVEATDADRELFVKLTGYDSNSIDAILGGSAFTWEVEQIARHRIAERERVVREIVAWLRDDARMCDCFARSDTECACGAWDDWKTVAMPPLIDRIEAEFGKSKCV